MSAQEVILNSASEYVTWDPNEETKAQIASYAAEMNITKLSGVLSSRLEFGTAGLRGPMGAGYNRMNDLVLMQTSQGICRYLIDQLGEEAKSKVLTSINATQFRRTEITYHLSLCYRFDLQFCPVVY